MTGPTYRSETSYFRHVVAPLIPEGNGLDIGHGGDPVVPHAIALDRRNEHQSPCGDSPTHIAGDAARLHWFADGVLDFVYSSHCLEDFEDTEGILREWLRVLRRPGGRLILLLPDQRLYVAHCKRHHTEPNGAHKHENFGPGFLDAIMDKIGGTRRIFAWGPEGYNFARAYEMT